MATWLVVLLFSIGAVLLFVVGLSLTLMIKGHNIDSEIATNKNMRARGITCAAQDARHNHASSRKSAKGGQPDCADAICGDHNCASCTDPSQK